MNPKRPNRYPGVQPFQKEQAHLFFGRDDDTERLYDLIFLEKLVVLFGKSGYGKSSLLNAGILPLLEKETANGKRKYVPVRVRFNTWSEQGETLFAKFIFHLITSLQENIHPRKAISLGPDNIPETLWSVLKFSRPTPDTAFILIFDQFEEFFTYPEQQQQEFKRQLAEVLYADVPTYVKQNEDKHSPEEIAFLSEKMDVRTVFSIRADRMSDLDRLKDKLPAILHKRCELRALNREQAREALVEPARKSGNFASPSFAWSDAALKRILDAFSRDNAGREVGAEAFLLQVLAQNVESQVIRGAIANRDGLPTVRPEDLPADLSNIFSEYYRNKIGDLPPEQQLPARKLIEDGLIFATGEGDARRLSMDADVLMKQSGADQNLLKALEDTFLLRREVNTTGGWNYELSHDTLLKPVLDWREERRAEEEQEQQRIEAEKARERAEALEVQAEEEKKLRLEALQQKRLVTTLLWLFLGTIFVLGYFLGRVQYLNKQIKQASSKFNSIAFETARKDWEIKHNYTLKEDEWKTKLDTLDFSAKGLLSLPDEIFMCENLVKLDLSGNQISELPNNILQLKKLQDLDLGINSSLDLKQVIDVLHRHGGITSFSFGFNELSELPPSIKHLKKIKYLYLYRNKLKKLPDEIKELKNLEIIVLGENPELNFENTFAQLSNLKKLNWLSIGKNQITKLSPEIGKLENLAILDLGGNRLSTLPVEIRNLKNLLVLTLVENPIPSNEVAILKELVPYFCRVSIGDSMVIYHNNIYIKETK